jgi:ribosomal protein S18 acetylase RimI-like enzyme
MRWHVVNVAFSILIRKNMKPTVSTDLEIEVLNSVNPPTFLQENAIVEFLHEHLAHYGDPKPHIQAAINFACSHHKGKGGVVLVAKISSKIVGAVVINHTGMSGYIPENILVYIAVDASQRGKGIGSKLMDSALKITKGDVALHVEADNPAKKLYERLGFTNKYLEMRYKSSGTNSSS